MPNFPASLPSATPATHGEVVGEVRAIAALHLTRTSVIRAATLSCSTATWTLVGFDTELWDTATMHDTVTDNSRVAAPVAGVYQVLTSVQWATAVGGLRALLLRKNSAGAVGSGTQLYYDSRNATGTADDTNLAAVEVSLTAGDYVEVFAYQSSGSTQVLPANAANLQMRLVAM